MNAGNPIPVVLFAYARPDHTRRTLESLRLDKIPLLYVYIDGPKPETAAKVEEVARCVAGIDWCEVHVTRRTENMGLGRSIRTGVSECFKKHEALIVFEDDLVCVPGTYSYFCAALDHYRDDPRVMSVTARTHPRLTPPDIGNRPYFDGRFESWTWGTWRRAWEGMDEDALSLLGKCRAHGIDVEEYGGDLVAMAEIERTKNIWAVRFVLLHLLKKGLCLRPPVSLVNHIGYGNDATNCIDEDPWNVDLPARSEVDLRWPEAIVDPRCGPLWRAVHPSTKALDRGRKNIRKMLRKTRNLILGGLRKNLGIDLRSKTPTPSRTSEIYPTREAAVAACADGAYENGNLVKMIVEKNLALRRRLASTHSLDLGTMRTLAAIALAASGGELRVLDFGGGGGYHHTLARIALGVSAKLRWNVVETTAMAAEAKRMEGDGLRFFTGIEEARADLGTVDLVFTSSALQYCPDPLGFLRQLLAVGARSFFLTRTPFVEGAAPIVTVQHSRLADNGPGPLPPGFVDQPIAYPCVIPPLSEARRLIEERYSIRFEIAEEKGVFKPGGHEIDYWGCFADLR